MSNLFRAGLIITLGAVVAPLGAQNSAEITGAVTDSTGAAITRATVTVTALATRQTRRVVTNYTCAHPAPFLVPCLQDHKPKRSRLKVARPTHLQRERRSMSAIESN